MKRLFILFYFFCAAISMSAQDFDNWFYDRTMRFDYYHAGDATSQTYFFDEIIAEPYFAGSKKSLIDHTGLGVQMFKIIDKATGTEIYSRSFCTLFNEWQTTEEAKHIQKAMPESVVFPYPKRDVIIEFYARKKDGFFEKKYSQEIDVESYFIRPFTPKYETTEIMYNGNPHQRVDMVLIPEGYSEAEKEKFLGACRVFVDEFFAYSPFKENQSRFNVRAVWAPSTDSGVSIPGEHLYKETITKATFYTFDVERYQMIEDFQSVRDVAAHVPYDYIYVLSNTQKYGGGGIYNFYGISAAHHPTRTGKIYVHEFGHVMMGLGDEYYTSDVAYSDMYPFEVEPWEPNLTTLVDFESKEWSKMLDKKTPVPTPENKKKPELLGVFEGGGYSAKGIYRPKSNCLMNNLHTTDHFCPVCEKALQGHIDFLCR